MLLIFPIIFVASFIIAFQEVLRGNRAGVILFILFGLSIYTTAMSVAFTYGFSTLIPVFQFFKEVIILTALGLCVYNLSYRPKLHVIDKALIAFFIYTFIYAILPIGDQTFTARLLALKSTSFFVVVYFTGRLIDIRTVYVNKYFNFILILTIAAGVVVAAERYFYTHLQVFTGLAEYVYYYFNFEPSGSYGLSTTFESDGGYKRFGSFFANPLEHASATLVALSVIIALYTKDDNKLKVDRFGLIAFGASLLSIMFALSRAPMASYFFVIYMYALVTRKKLITYGVHAAGLIGIAYIIYLFSKFEQPSTGALQVFMDTLDFSNPSSVGHVVQWVEGITAIANHPLGLGLGSSGRVAATISENVGGENQYIIIGVQAGLIALCLYLYVYIMLIKTSYNGLSELKGKERQICMAVLLMKIGFFIPLLTSEVESSSYISYINWFLSGLFISIIMQPKNVAPVPQPALT